MYLPTPSHLVFDIDNHMRLAGCRQRGRCHAMRADHDVRIYREAMPNSTHASPKADGSIPSWTGGRRDGGEQCPVVVQSLCDWARCHTSGVLSLRSAALVPPLGVGHGRDLAVRLGQRRRLRAWSGLREAGPCFFGGRAALLVLQ